MDAKNILHTKSLISKILLYLLNTSKFVNEFFVYIGHRFRTTYDFGFAALDILNVYGEDSGQYMCRATNKLGQATSSVKLSVKSMCLFVLKCQNVFYTKQKLLTVVNYNYIYFIFIIF